MARPAQGHLLNHPLKLLRRKLGYITQDKLAKISRNSVESIKMAEAGQRSMGPTIQSKIAANLNLVFDTKEQQWVKPGKDHKFYCFHCGQELK